MVSASILSLLVLVALARRGPNVVLPCQKCEEMPVSLNITTEAEPTNMLIQFRPTTRILKACVEFRIPVKFKIPSSNDYTTRIEGQAIVVTKDGFDLDATDSKFEIRSVTNPNSGSYGPFSIRTKACCECQVVDESLNFYFLYIEKKPSTPLSYSLTVYDSFLKNATATPLPIYSQVTLSLHISQSISQDEEVWIKFNPPLWDSPTCVHPYQCITLLDGWIILSRIDEVGEFSVELTAKAPYYAIQQGIEYQSMVRKMVPPVNSTTSTSKIVFAEGSRTHMLWVSPGNVYNVDFRPANGLEVGKVRSGEKLYANLTFDVEHPLSPGGRVEVDMTSDCTGDCVCWVKEKGNVCNCTCEVGKVVVRFDNPMQESQIRVKMLLSVNYDYSFAISSVTTYDDKNRLIDSAHINHLYPLQVLKSQDFLFFLTDQTGTTLRNTAGDSGVSMQVSIPTSDFLNKSDNIYVKLTCPQSFQLQPNAFISIQSHSSDFTSDKICNRQTVNANPTYINSNWEITAGIQQFLPLTYGSLVLMVSKLTLPAVASNPHTAYECQIELKSDTDYRGKTQQIDILPSTNLTANVFYYCVLSASGMPIGVLLNNIPFFEAYPGRNMFKLDIEFLADEQYGFPYMFGTGLNPKDDFSHVVEINKQKYETKMKMYGDGKRAWLTLELPSKSSNSSLLIKFPIGEQKSYLKDIVVLLRVYYLSDDISLRIEQITHEVAVVLASKLDSNAKPPPGLSLTVTESMNNGQLAVSYTGFQADTRFISLAFPPNTSLSNIHFSSPSIAYQDFTWTDNRRILLIRSNEANFNISNIGFRPHYNLTLQAAMSANLVEQQCISYFENTFPTELVIELACPCQQKFSMKRIRTNIIVKVTVQNGLPANTEILAIIDKSWGVKKATCSIDPPELANCKLSSDSYELRITLVEEVEDLASFFVVISKLKAPDKEGQSLFSATSLVGWNKYKFTELDFSCCMKSTNNKSI